MLLTLSAQARLAGKKICAHASRREYNELKEVEIYQADGGSLAGKLSSTVISCALSIDFLRPVDFDQTAKITSGSVIPKRR